MCGILEDSFLTGQCRAVFSVENCSSQCVCTLAAYGDLRPFQFIYYRYLYGANNFKQRFTFRSVPDSRSLHSKVPKNFIHPGPILNTSQLIYQHVFGVLPGVNSSKPKENMQTPLLIVTVAGI